MSESSASGDQHLKSPHPGIVESDGKWIPRTYFLRYKYEHGRFDSQDDAILAYNTMTSRVQAVLMGKGPNMHGSSVEASGDYFESVEWRVQVLEEELVRRRQSDASSAARLSLADVRMRAADEKHKRDLGQVRDELHATQNARDQAKQDFEEKLRILRDRLYLVEKERDQMKDRLRVAQTELGQVKSQAQRSDDVQAIEKERDQAHTDLGKVKLQLGRVEKEHDHVKEKLGRVEKEHDHVKEKLRTVEKERDQARADSNKVRSVLCTIEKGTAEKPGEQNNGAEVGPKRTYSEMQATSQTARFKEVETELETEREKNVKLQLALNIKTNDLEKELKRRRQCHCILEVVEILD